jgi:hypothetical protein
MVFQKVGKRIKIGSLNIQNIRGNTIFVQTVMKKTEILFIQEHWLFKFEEHSRILKKAVGMGCLRVFEHHLIPRLWLQFSVIVHGFLLDRYPCWCQCTYGCG